MKMACVICLELCDNGISIASDEGVALNLNGILLKYFSFCFEDNDDSENGIVCRPCWLSIDSIHKFYDRIRNAHRFRNRIDDKLNLLVEVKTEVEDDENSSPMPVTNITIKDKTNTTNGSKSKRKYKKRLKELPANGDEIASKDGKGVFTCSQCDLPFLKKFILLRHMKVDHNLLEYRCRDAKCYESFNTETERNDHMTAHHARSACPKCNKNVSSAYLPKHMNLFHNESKRVICHLCGRVSSNPQSHKLHFEIAHIEAKLQCDICKAWLSNRHSIQKHMQLVHIRRPVQCEICLRMFKHKNSLRQHVRNHDIAVRKKVKCLVCGKGFRDKNNLKQHSSIHENQEFRCTFCDRSYRSERSMKRHVRVEHELGESNQTTS